MRCRKCDHDLEVTHVYSSSSTGETRRAVCSKCRTPHTLVTIAFEVPRARPRGYGAWSVASEMALRERRGETFAHVTPEAEVRVFPQARAISSG